ncbi:MAG: hypothetical protein IAI49_12980 [Candidatus Eremiobacteraeota bacterium]|nr:hypothetical protein [Candidatus Eremiobacteraeota bacterium]
MASYEFAHVLPASADCSMQAYVVGPDLLGSKRAARATLTLDGERIAEIAFRGRAPDFPVEEGRIAPVGLKPAAIAMTPLYNPYGLVFPVSPRFCQAKRWDVGIMLRDARWSIERVGIIAHYTPVTSDRGTQGTLNFWLAIASLVLLIVAIHALFDAIFRRFGPYALLLTLVVFLAALVTHDEWDFLAWLRITDLVAFGHGNPAYMWAGSPLWAFMLAGPAPILSAFYARSGDGSQEVTALVLKLAMALAACTNAYLLVRSAPKRARGFFFPVLLLSPFALYELGGGYRELFAGSFALAGCALCLRRRYTFAAVAFALAASITESLLPLVLLPMTLRIGERRNVWRAAIDALAGVAPLALEWAFLVPHSVATMTVSARITDAYRFGGGSWYSALDGFGLLPAWVGTHSLLVVVVLFAALCAPLAIRLVLDLRSATNPEGLQRRIFGAFLGFVVAFFLAYRGVDPSTWYALLVIVTFYFLRFDAFNPLPILLTTLQAFAFYTILGIGDFANWTYLAPQNRSLLGVLGQPVLISVLTVNATVLALYVSLLRANTSLLFGRGSVWFLTLFCASAMTSAIRMYPIDLFFCGSVTLLTIVLFGRLSHVRESSFQWQRLKVVDYIGLAASIVAGTAGGTHYGAASIVGFVGFALGLTYGFGLCDIVLTAAGSLLLGAQTGYGWVSIGGWIALSLLALVALSRVYPLAAKDFESTTLRNPATTLK